VSTTRARLGLVGASILGSIVGAAVMQWSVRTPTPAVPTQAPLVANASDVAAGDRVDPVLAEVTQRLRDLEQRQDDLEEETKSAAEPSSAVAAPPTDPEALRRAAADEAAATERAFEAEPIDARWARQARQDFDADLASLGEASGVFQVVEVTCRSSQCRSVLSFKDRGDALAVSGQLMSNPYKHDCTRSLFALEPEPNVPVAAEYLATLYFDCSEGKEPPSAH
jgi:hypothetical protein